MEDRPDYVRPNHVGTAVPENMADRPDYHGSLNPLLGSQRSMLFDPTEMNKQRALFQQIGSYSASPIKVFTVCVDQMNGKFMAFLGSDPTKKATAGSRSEAIHTLLVDNKIITETEIS